MTSRIAEKSSVPDALLISGPPVLRTEQVHALLGAPDCRTRKATRLTVANVQQTRAGRLRLTFQTAKARDVCYRTVTLPLWAAQPVNSWLAYARPANWLFPGQGGRHLTVSGAEKIVKRHLR